MAFESNLRYNCRAALILGLLQVLMGVLVFMLQIPYITHDLAAVFAYVGFWAGLVFLVSGILALVSWKQNSSRMIVAVMVVSIVTSLVALAGVIAATSALIVGTIPSMVQYEGDDHYKYKLTEDLSASQIVFCIVEGILAVVMAGYCCAAVCCGRKQSEVV